jgi:hypothetical protein
MEEIQNIHNNGSIVTMTWSVFTLWWYSNLEDELGGSKFIPAETQHVSKLHIGPKWHAVMRR